MTSTGVAHYHHARELAADLTAASSQYSVGEPFRTAASI